MANSLKAQINFTKLNNPYWILHCAQIRSLSPAGGGWGWIFKHYNYLMLFITPCLV